MSTAFNTVTHDLFQRVTDHINSLLALCAELAATAKAYGHTEDEIKTSFDATNVSRVAAPTPATAPPPDNGLPLRPATLRIAGVDPCTLLTQAQYTRLGVNA